MYIYICYIQVHVHVYINMYVYIIDIDMGNRKSGTPLLQMMVYAKLQEKEKELNANVITFLIERGANLGRVLKCGSCTNCTALEMAIDLQCIDIAKLLVQKRADPIYGGDGIISPVFFEYGQFGTSTFLQWLLQEYQDRQEIPAFIDRFLDSNVLYREKMQHTIMDFGRNPAHTFLLSRNDEAITYLVEKNRDVLKESDPFKRTALHLAAENGDTASVKILLNW